MYSPVKQNEMRSPPISFRRAEVLALILAVTFLASPHGRSQQAQHAGMPGMNMHDHEDMSDMGPSMAAMSGHMYMTLLRPKQPDDLDKAKTVVATVKASIERYKDYRKALLDGYHIANPKLKQPQYHFISDTNTREADLHFDPSKPTALLYRRTPKLEYMLEGVMFTANPDATEDELNQRVPLSIGRWHRHVNVCWAPEEKVNDYKSAHPKFGMFGSINSKEACEAERGDFHPYMFTWMIHIFPYEPAFKDVFSVNDDISHVH